MKRYWFIEGIILWVDAIIWGFQLVYGVYKLSRLKGTIVTIFGGKGIDLGSEDEKKAYELGTLCVKNGFSVITGGGPGSMEAAQCGAADYSKKTGLRGLYALGIGVHGVDRDFESRCAPVFFARHMFIRKLFLIRYSCAFIVLPGGLGTADELFEVLNLKKLKRIGNIPVILLGTAYWQPLLDWYHNYGIKAGFIKQEYKDLYTVTDDLDYVIRLIKKK